MAALIITADWDEEANVWVATSDDIIGLVTEADTLEALRDKLADIVPELIAENGLPDGADFKGPIEIVAAPAPGNPRCLMVDFGPELRRKLRAAGCFHKRNAKDDHEFWQSPITNRSFPVDGKIKSRHSANEVLKQAGLPKAF